MTALPTSSVVKASGLKVDMSSITGAACTHRLMMHWRQQRRRLRIRDSAFMRRSFEVISYSYNYIIPKDPRTPRDATPFCMILTHS